MERILRPGRQKSGLWLYVFSCTLLLSQSLWWTFQRLYGTDSPGVFWAGLGAAALVSAVLAFPVSSLFCSFLEARWLGRVFADRAQQKKIPLVFLWGLCFFLWIPTFLAYYPGILAYDFYAQYVQYFEQSFNTHHPLAHTWLMGKLLEVGLGIFGSNNAAAAFYTLCQLLAVSLAVSYVVYALQAFGLPRWLLLGAAVFYFLLPMTPVMAISATKDVLFVCVFMVGLMKAIPLCANPWQWKQAIPAGVCLALSLLLRNNALHGLLLTIGALGLSLAAGKNKGLRIKWIVLCLLVIAAGKGMGLGMESLLDAQKGSNAEMLSIPAQQLSYVSINREGELTQQEKETLDWYAINQAYHPWIADDVKNNMSISNIDADIGAFLKFWLSLGGKFPADYVNVFLTQSEPLWYFETAPILMAKDCYLEFTYQPDEFPLESKFARLLILDRILFGSDAWVLKIPVVSLLHHPALYFWLLLAVLAALLHTKQYAYLALPLLPLGYLATLLLGPCILPRYCLPGFYAAPVVLLVCLRAMVKAKK